MSSFLIRVIMPLNMQTIVQVFSRGSASLRTQIVGDRKLKEYGLVASAKKKQGRSHGWAKLNMAGSDGVINIEWHAATQTLICRIVTKGGEPHDIAGAFIRFLLARFEKQIASILILPRI